MLTRLFAATLPLLASAWPALADCNVISLDQLVQNATALRAETDDARLIALEIRAAQGTGDAATGFDAMVLTEQILRGGSDSRVLVEGYQAQPGGVCDAPSQVELAMDLSVPYQLQTLPSDQPGPPGFEIRYRFWASNSFGNYDTSSAYVTDDRRERYQPKDGQYERTEQEILNCIICAKEIDAQPK